MKKVKEEQPSQEPELKLTPEEKALLESQRERSNRLKTVELKLVNILNEYNAVLVVDPNSPIGQPSIIVQLAD